MNYILSSFRKVFCASYVISSLYGQTRTEEGTISRLGPSLPPPSQIARDGIKETVHDIFSDRLFFVIRYTC
jgi:hypothetical protein